MRPLSTLLLFAVSVIPAAAQTDPATLQFLQKLDGYYSCLEKQGLQNYVCDAQIRLAPECAAALQGTLDPQVVAAVQQINCHFSFTPQKTRLSWAKASPTGVANLDAQVSRLKHQFAKLVVDDMDIWKAMAFKPIHSTRELAGTCLVTRLTSGFTVRLQNSGEDITQTFGADAHLMDTNGVAGAFTLDLKTQFGSGPKGFLLVGCQTVVGQAQVGSSYAYTTADGYPLIQEMRLDTAVEGSKAPPISLIIDFSNFKTNQLDPQPAAPKLGAPEDSGTGI